MINQKTLFGKVLELPKTKQELNEICCERCYTASEQKCICKCKGKWHGLGNLNKRQLPECQSIDKIERTLSSLKIVGGVGLEP